MRLFAKCTIVNIKLREARDIRPTLTMNSQMLFSIGRSLVLVVGGYFFLPKIVWHNPTRATMKIPIWIRSE